MQRIIKLTLIIIALVALNNEPTLAQEKQAVHPNEQAAKEAKATYTCPMHPDVKADKPGKCPECGMNLVLAEDQQKGEGGEKSTDNLSAKDKVEKAKQLLAEAKEEMYYNCCLKTPCDRCALDHQSCSCSKDIKSGKGICSDCYAGWQLGEGKNIPGITKENVKPNFHSHHH